MRVHIGSLVCQSEFERITTAPQKFERAKVSKQQSSPSNGCCVKHVGEKEKKLTDQFLTRRDN